MDGPRACCGGTDVLSLVVDGRIETQVRAARELGEHRVENFAADVVEEHLDAVGRVFPQRGTDVLSLVVDGRIETQVLDNPAALLRPARDSDRPASLDLGDLPGDAPDGPARTRDDHRVGLVQAAKIEQPELRVRPVTPSAPR